MEVIDDLCRSSFDGLMRGQKPGNGVSSGVHGGGLEGWEKEMEKEIV